jgi:plastocyanin
MRSDRLLSVLALLFGLVVHASAQTVVTGTVTVARQGAGGGAAVVYAQPLDRAGTSTPGSFTLAQRQKAFQPGILGIPAGSTVEFPNQDAIFHNVFSLSAPSPFDLGLYRAGASKSRVFKEPAVYRVFCNIHPQMSAVIVVAPTAYVTTTDRDGRYTLSLPPGRYRITAATGRSVPVWRDVAVTAGTTAVEPIAIDERTLVETPHTNKFGKPYPREAYTR